MTDKISKVRRIMEIGSAILIIIFPIILMTAFALHFDNIADFFIIEWRYTGESAPELMSVFSDSYTRFRMWVLPHYLPFLAIPLQVVLALTLARVIFKERPWLALLGSTFATFGAVFMGGVFGAWTSFAAVGNVESDQIQQSIPALQALITREGPLLLTTILSAFSMVGMFILGVGLYLSTYVKKWSGVLFFIGNVLILIFMDLDNWMFLGALLMLIAIIPISMKLLRDGFPLANLSK